MQNSQKHLNASLRLLAKSSFVVLITVLLSKILTYIYKIVLAREYGAESYGVFVLSLMLVGWLTIFSKLGFGEGLARFIPLYKAKNENNKASYLIKKSLTITASLSIISGVLLFAVSRFIAVNIFGNLELEIFLKIFSLAIPLTVLSSIYLSILRAYEEIFWVSFIGNILQSIVNLGTILLLIFLNTGAISISISYTLGMLAVLITSRILVHKKVPKNFDFTAIKEKNRLFKEFSSYSTPLIFFGIIISILHWTDSFMIGILRSVREVGLYNAAVPISLLITISIDLFRQLFLPLVTKEYSKNEIGNVRELSKQIGKWVYMVSLPVFILLYLYPDFFIELLFGAEFVVAAGSLRILAIGAMFVSLFEVSKELLSMEGKSGLILKDTLAVFIINVVLNLVLIPKFGINGAAIATTTSLATLGVMFALQARKDLNIIPLRKKMLNISIAGFGAMISLIALNSLIADTIVLKLLSFCVFLGIYVLLIFVIGCLDKNDKSVLSAIRLRFMR